jgi:uroporphyrinogen decarboxylase
MGLIDYKYSNGVRMNGRQILLDAINGKKPGRTPVVLFSAGAWTFNSRGLTLSQVIGHSNIMAEAIIETFLRKAPSDAVWVGSGFNNLPVKALGGSITYPGKGTPQVSKYAVEEASDLDRMDPSGLARDPDVPSLWDTTALVRQGIGEKTLIGACGWGPFTLAGQMYGTERLMSGIYKDPASVQRVLNFSVEASVVYYRGFIEKGAEIISIAEPLASGDMISRKHFERFVMPAVRRFMDRLKGLKAINLLHICGNITNRLDLIPDMGVDVLSVDYKVDLKKVREAAGTRIAFAGNVNPADILQAGTADDVTDASHRCIEAGGEDGNFILMPGCDIPPTVPIGNIRAFFDAPLTYGRRN